MSDTDSDTDDVLIGGGLLLIVLAGAWKILLVVAEIASWIVGAALVIGAAMFLIGIVWRVGSPGTELEFAL